MKACLGVMLAAVLVTACQYDESIADPAIKPPGSLVGKWQISGSGFEGKPREQSITIEQISENRLLIDHQFGDKHWFFYGRGVFANHPEILELEYFGQGPGLPCETARYAIVIASAAGDSLMWYPLEKNRLDPGNGGAVFREKLNRALELKRYMFETHQTYQKVKPLVLRGQ